MISVGRSLSDMDAEVLSAERLLIYWCPLNSVSSCIS